MDQGTEFGADFQHRCQSRCILPVVTDLETPWWNSVVERHGALFKMACRAMTTGAQSRRRKPQRTLVEESVFVHRRKEGLKDGADLACAY